MSPETIELRELREQVVQLRQALQGCVDWMEFTIPRLHTTPSGSIERMNYGGPLGKARTALSNTEGGAQ